MRADAPSRLLGILEELPVPSHNLSSQREVWARILGVDSTDTHGILQGIASVLILVADAKNTVCAVIGNENAGLHLQAFDRLDTAFAGLSINSTPNDFLTHIDTARTTLRFTVDLVVRLGIPGELDEALLSQLIDDVNDHLEELASSGLPKDARVILYHRLVQLRDAAEGLRLHGLDHLASTLDATVGAAMRVAKDIDVDKPEHRQWYERLFATLDVGLKVAYATEKAQQLVGFGEKLLGST